MTDFRSEPAKPLGPLTRFGRLERLREMRGHVPEPPGLTAERSVEYESSGPVATGQREASAQNCGQLAETRTETAKWWLQCSPERAATSGTSRSLDRPAFQALYRL